MSARNHLAAKRARRDERARRQRVSPGETQRRSRALFVAALYRAFWGLSVESDRRPVFNRDDY